MISVKAFCKLALSFPGAEEQPHFERSSFRFKKKIFATLDKPGNTIVVKLIPDDQFVYCKIDPEIIYPVAGSWGTKGWTTINLKKIPGVLLKEILLLAYKTVGGGRIK